MDKITITFEALEAINATVKSLTSQNVNLKRRITELEALSPMKSPGEFTIAMGTSAEDSSASTLPKCEFCLECHPEKECCYQTWMDVLESAPLIQPSPILKRIRLVHNKWVVLLVPNFHPVIISRYYDYEFVALSEKDKFEIETELSLSRFKYLNPTSLTIISSVAGEISNWLAERRLDVF